MGRAFLAEVEMHKLADETSANLRKKIEVKFTHLKSNLLKVKSLVAISTFTKLCSHHFYLVPKHFTLPPKETPYPLSSVPHCPLSPTPGYHQSALLCLWVACAGYFVEWHPSVCSLVCLAAFTSQYF